MGLGLLPLRTTYAADKLTEEAECVFGAVPEPWSQLTGIAFRGYQIRHGQSVAGGGAPEVIDGGLGFVRGSVLAVCAHGMLEAPAVLQALFGMVPPRPLDKAFDELADAIEDHLDVTSLMRQAAII